MPVRPVAAQAVRRARRARSWRAGAAASVAASVLMVLVACTPVQVEPTRSPTPMRTSTIATDGQLQDAADGRLPRDAGAAGSLVFTTAVTEPTEAAIDMTDKDLLLVAACDGGGAIVVRISSTPDRVLQCDGLHSLGPIDVSTALGTDPPGSAQFDVRASSGHPHYFARAAAVDEEAVP